MKLRQIEQVAMVLHRFTNSSVGWADLSEDEKESYRAKARAAIEALG